MDVECRRLTPPFPDDFVAWYPYVKDEVLPVDRPWRRWLDRVMARDTGYLRDSFVVASDRDSGAYLGVVWCCLSPVSPELSHFGWFLVEEAYRCQGLGGRIIQAYLSAVENEGVEMVMLPTEIANELAVGIYQRRGWEIAIAEPEGRGSCWMVREPEMGYQERYFTRAAGDLAIAPVAVEDAIALDYLLCRPATPSRLYPLGLMGRRRLCSFTDDWSRVELQIARKGGRPVGVAAVGSEGVVDAFAFDQAVLRELFDSVLHDPEAQVLAAESDRAKYEALRTLGLRPGRAEVMPAPGGPVTLRRYARKCRG